MTTTLHQALAELAGDAPQVRVPADLWRRGRRIRRRRRVAAVLACLVVGLTAAWLPTPTVTGSQVGAAEDQTLPASVAQPYLWQQTFSGEPNGPAKLTFETGHSLDLESSLVIVGRDDSFRLMYLDPGDWPGSLSPDGRYLLSDRLLDLVTGRSRTITPALSSGSVVWSPDSRSAVAVIGHDDVVPTTGPDGARINDPTRLDNIVIVDVPDGSMRVVRVAEAAAYRAAFSPDGTRLAVTVGPDGQHQELLILDVATGAVQRSVPLGDRQQIAGGAAWSPDGRHVVLAFTGDCPPGAACGGPGPGRPAPQAFHLQYLDVDTGTITDEAVRDRPGRPDLIGWRQGAPVLSVTSDIDGSCTIVRLPDGRSPEALPLRAAGRGCPSYPRDALEHWVLGGPSLTPSPWQAQSWAYAVLALVVLIGAALVVKRVRRRRRRSWARS